MAAYALIAEPDPGQAQLYRHLAQAEGFEVRVVRDGEQGREALRAFGAPALTIAELALAKVDGFQLISEIRRLEGPEHASVVVVSAFRALRDAAIRLRSELGISALLARSAPVESLRRALKKVMAASQAPHGPAPVSAPPVPSGTVVEIDEERAEEVRLHRLDQMQLAVQGNDQDEGLRAIAEATAGSFGVPIAMISLVLEDRQWALAHFGLQGDLLKNRSVPREVAFCSLVVQGRQPLVVPDTTAHPAFAGNPLVRAGAIRGYAGAPVEIASGDILGTLCVWDVKPLALGADDVDRLVLGARRVAGELELRAARRRQQHERQRLPEPLQQQISGDQQLSTALSYLSAVMDNIDNGVFLLDPQHRVVFANQALADLFGLTADSLIGKRHDEMMSEAAELMSDPHDFRHRLRTSPEGPWVLRGEFEMERPRRRFVRWTAKPVQLGQGIGHLAVLTDITAEVELMREREQLARTDPVTGLMNRRAAEEVLEREASRAQRFGSRISVALLDIDHFKQVNDRHGHAAGDEALRAVAQIVSSAMRGVDVAARWGGDELIVILPATGLEGARSFGERVRAAVERLEPAIMRGATVSVGVSELHPGEDWADAVRRADAKLYEAKDAGRNRVA